MDRQEILSKLIELKKLQRTLKDLAKELDIEDISNDNIYVGICAYKSVLMKMLNTKEVDEE